MMYMCEKEHVFTEEDLDKSGVRINLTARYGAEGPPVYGTVSTCPICGSENYIEFDPSIVESAWAEYEEHLKAGGELDFETLYFENHGIEVPKYFQPYLEEF